VRADPPGAVSVGELLHGALDSGADRVAGLPVGCLLIGSDTELQVTEFPRGKPTVRALSAVVAQWVGATRAATALALGEPGHEQRGGG
jgi:hypothetical protein